MRKGDVVAAVETEKGIIDIEAFEGGVVERLEVQPGTRVAVGAPLALFAGAAGPAAPSGGLPRPAGGRCAATGGTGSQPTAAGRFHRRRAPMPRSLASISRR